MHAIFITRFGFIGLILLCLSACGFHLRGHSQIPKNLMTLTLVSSDDLSPLSKSIKTQLQLHKINLVAAAEDIPSLYIGEEQVLNRTLSLYKTGQVAEYEMSYTVDIKLRRKNQLDKHFKIKFHRDYLDDPVAALAKSQEREMIMTEFRTMAGEQIVRYLATIE